MKEEDYTNKIISAAIDVHRRLGPGLLESTYQKCLSFELRRHGLKIVVEKPMGINYKELFIPKAYRIDILVERTTVVELKTVSEITNLHISQTLTYMKLGGYKTALILNFNVQRMKDGIKRLVM